MDLTFQLPSNRSTKLKNNMTSELTFSVMRANKNFQFMCEKNKERRRLRTLRLSKNFNGFMRNQTKHNEREHFCLFCLQCFT